MIATGRHTSANAEPSISPPARLNVPRYSASLTLMQWPSREMYPWLSPTPHDCALVTGSAPMNTVPLTYIAATTTAMNTLAHISHSATRGRRSPRLRSRTTITSGHTR